MSGTTFAGSATPVSVVGGDLTPAFTRAALATYTVAANQYVTVAGAGTGTNEVLIQNTTPTTVTGALYVDPTGASGTTLAKTSVQVAAGGIISIENSASAVTVFATVAGLTFSGWRG